MTTFYESSVNRDAGGRFDVKQHSDAEGVLPDAWVTEREPVFDPKVTEDMFEQVRRHARRFARRYNFDRETEDDIVQDTMLDLLNKQKRHSKGRNDAALWNQATRAVAQRHLDPGEHHYVLTARKFYSEQARQMSAELGRDLTSREEDALARDIRENMFEPGRRPRENFHRKRTPVSLSMPLGHDSDITLGDTITATGTPRARGEAAMYAGAGDVPLEEKAEVRQAKASPWDAMRDESTPAVVAGAIPDRFEHRCEIVRMGGAAAAVRAYEYGELSPAQAETFFRPWAADTPDKRDRVVATLTRNPAYIDRLYDAVLTEERAAK